MINWNFIVIGMSSLLLLFLCRKEISRINKSALVLRLVASALGLASLAFMALPLSMPGKKSIIESKEAIVLTDGFNEDSLQAFIKKNNNNIQVYQQDSIAWIDTSFTLLHIFGYGLTEDELKLTDGIPLAFHPSPLNNGITAVHWKQQLNTGEKLLVQGSFANTKPSPVKIILQGFHASLDSVNIPANKTENFELGTVPKHIGKAVYSLIFLHRQDTLEMEPVPVEVKKANTLNILVLAASPGFENKFLRTWLAANSFGIASRTRISKDKYDKAFTNLPSFGFEKITRSLLSPFDIIISDATELAALSKSEQSAIYTAVQEDGTGLIVNADSIASPAAFYSSPFTQYPASVKHQSSTTLFINDAGKPTAPLPAEEHSFIRFKTGTQPLVLDSALNILVSCILQGYGKIVFTTVNNTYTWMLSGNRNDYYSFWLCLLQKAGKKTGSDENMLIGGKLPRPDEPVELSFETSNPTIARPFISSNYLSLQQNPDLDFQWRGIYWPEKYGWQPAIISGGRQYEWYVYDKADWKNISAIEKARQTRQYINNKNNTAKKMYLVKKYSGIARPGPYFFLIFIICCSFLWMEKKMKAAS